MNTEQTTAKRHGPSRVTTVICLALILCAALVIARMVKFRSQVDVTHGCDHHAAFSWRAGQAVGAG